MGQWADNPFREDLVRRLAAAEATTNPAAMAYDDDEDAWSQACAPGLACMPVLLQGRRLVLDVTDRGMALYPLGLAGRFHVEVGFAGLAGPAERLLTRPGAAVLAGAGWTVTTRVSPDAPVVSVTLRRSDEGAVTPYLHWVPGERDGGFLSPADAVRDPVIARNNSGIPDPPPPPDRPRAGIAVSGSPVGEAPVPRPLLLTDTVYEAGRVHRIDLAATSDAELTVLLSVVSAPDVASPAAPDPAYWDQVAGRLAICAPDGPLSRQVRFSVHNSLFSRATTDGGRDIFVHGRRDRGYADASHLHQSYQMHLPALASGESASVRDELLAYAALQRPDGWIEAAPRPGGGWSRYVGRYTGAHLLMAVHRYLSWTGDRALLDEPVAGPFDRESRPFGDRVERAARDLLATRVDGVLAPCGWADAWNPQVRAQAQQSCAGVLGLRAWASVCRAVGDHGGAERWASAASELADATYKTFCDPRTGIVAEHLFADGVAGGTPDDFWAHTQIWAALAGVTADPRGLDLVRASCLDNGVAAAPESAFAHAYLAASTDSAASLPLESTATWLLARWPELTHLYALARIGAGDPDAALEAVHAQLPERLHRLDTRCAPYYYAEKYLHPGTRPWLCTWAGDPTLVEVLLAGFLGVRAEPDGLWIRPTLPSAWRGRPASARFVWRGAPHRLDVDPALPAGTLLVDGEPTAWQAPVGAPVSARPRVLTVAG